MVNRGKQFEDIVKAGIEKVEGVSIDRFYDVQGGYLGITTICDFVVFKQPFQLYIECKAVSVDNLNFKIHISKNQWDGLLLKSKIKGVIAGVLVWYTNRDTTFFIPIQELEKMREQGKKSINFKDTSPYIFPIKGRKKKVFFEYDFDDFLTTISKGV